MAKVLRSLLAAGYVGVALLTGVTRSKECVAGSVVEARPDRYGVVGALANGVFWPVTLYRFHARTGTVDGFFSRNGLCRPR